MYAGGPVGEELRRFSSAGAADAIPKRLQSFLTNTHHNSRSRGVLYLIVALSKCQRPRGNNVIGTWKRFSSVTVAHLQVVILHYILHYILFDTIL